MLKKASRLSLVEQVSSQMEYLIESGHWLIGDRLPPEMELMKTFDVSRNTLREAIRALVHAGLLETKQGSGTIVKSTNALGAALQRQVKKTSLLEILEVRLALEREAAQLAAIRRDEKDLIEMENAIIACQQAAEASDFQAFFKADIQFHETMVKAAHNSVLQNLYDHISAPLQASIENIMFHDKHFDYEREIHGELLQSIKQQDTEQAMKEVNQYIKHFKEKVNDRQEE